MISADEVDLAFLALYAEDAFSASRTYAGASLLSPPPDPRLSPDWTILGTLTATDAIFGPGSLRLSSERVFYGWLLECRGEFVVAIRGTGDAMEWAIDGAFMPRSAHPVAGRVETGFWSVYASMQIDGKPLVSLLERAHGPISVVGHSLGAAVATYAAFDLARAGGDIRGTFIASPRPGDGAFSKAFGQAVPKHTMYRNEDDVVPRVPFWFGYTAVPNVVSLSAAKEGVRIDGGLAGQHHILSYAALMNQAAFKAFKPLPQDRRFLNCIQVHA